MIAALFVAIRVVIPRAQKRQVTPSRRRRWGRNGSHGFTLTDQQVFKYL
jgi:hypothetical protein